MSEHTATQYPNYGPEVNAILDAARAARRVEQVIPGTPAANLVQHLEHAAQGWWWSLIDIVLDHEELKVKEDTPHPIDFVPAVTREHAENFAEGWFKDAWVDAIDEADLMTWPSDEDGGAAQMRYHAIQEEICKRVFADVKEPIIEAFLRAATEVLDRERSR
jgi:hypothetical protein